MNAVARLARRFFGPATLLPAALRAVVLSATFSATLACLACVSGCSTSARLDTPSGFATLGDDKTFAYRATSARGVVLAARAEKNELRANTEFWAESIDLRLSGAGYVKRSEQAVKSRGGLEGKQLRYTLTRNAREHRYWVTVFVKGDHVVLVEAAGDTAHFAPAEATVERAIASVRVD
ncbi:MAG: hypothetical protein IPF92_21235 [Myxococcales bacterium]|nr:hypothetical protein [Myxococcales bacterium]MBL0197523.1 hypothetical protein [Myxococcales bacterium]HQY61414.1 hypothetical protein [Polyangiaceae bacterium]